MFGLLSKRPKEKQESRDTNRDSMSVASTGTARSASGHNLTKSISKATMALTGSGKPDSFLTRNFFHLSLPSLLFPRSAYL